MMYDSLINKKHLKDCNWDACWNDLRDKVTNYQSLRGFFFDYYKPYGTNVLAFFNDIEKQYQTTSSSLQEDYVTTMRGFTFLRPTGEHVEVFLNDPNPKPKKISWGGEVSQNDFLAEYPKLPERLKGVIWKNITEARLTIEDFVWLWNRTIHNLEDSHKRFLFKIPLGKTEDDGEIAISFPVELLK